jgi:hypothetical protein
MGDTWSTPDRSLNDDKELEVGSVDDVCHTEGGSTGRGGGGRREDCGLKVEDERRGECDQSRGVRRMCDETST